MICSDHLGMSSPAWSLFSVSPDWPRRRAVNRTNAPPSPHMWNCDWAGQQGSSAGCHVAESLALNTRSAPLTTVLSP